MIAREIDRSEWQPFADAFSRQHDGWLVNLRAEEKSERRTADRRVHLRGLAVEPGRVHEAFIVLAESESGDHLSRAIMNPRRVVLETTDDGLAASVAVTAADGSRCVIEISKPAPELSVDGMLPGGRRHGHS